MSAKKKKASPASAPEPAGTKGREPDYTWKGKPVFKCHAKKGCQFERVDDLDAVLRHELLHAEGRPPDRESRIVGTDGKPLKVQGDHE